MVSVDTEWKAGARCRTADPDLFFSPGYEEAAKAVCARCPVQPECLDYALRTGQEEGVWGGLGAAERTAYLRAAVATSSPVPLDTVTYTTRARSTGAVCSAGRTEEGWGAACVTHGTSATARSRTDAEAAVSRPQQWCPVCARIAAGRAPRVEK